MSDYPEKATTIYAIRCTANGKVYVGRTTNVVTRVRQHMTQLKNGKKLCSIKREIHKTDFQKDYDLHGEGAFEFYILEDGIPAENSGEREQHWIDEYKATNPRYGYNRECCPNKSKIVYSEFRHELPPKIEVVLDEHI